MKRLLIKSLSIVLTSKIGRNCSPPHEYLIPWRQPCWIYMHGNECVERKNTRYAQLHMEQKKKTLNQSLKYLQMYAVPAQSTSGQSFYCNTNMNQDHEYLHVNCRDLDRTHNSRGANNCPTCWATPPSPPNNKMMKGRIKKKKNTTAWHEWWCLSEKVKLTWKTLRLWLKEEQKHFLFALFSP